MYMFDRKYIIKIYQGGHNIPLLQFEVYAQNVQVIGHSLKIDVNTLHFSDNHYISIEQA